MEIIKASAGSGKTYTLAKKYISLLFSKKDRYAYRHILAVTFTNKATDEMKGRIIKELSVLASEPEKSPYIDDLVPSVFDNPSGLGKAAGDMLSNILHDYSAFAVSTIDRFFQQTLKAFSREIGQFASYQVELDKNSLVAESVDRILDALTEDDMELLKWLTDSALEQIEKGGRYSLEQNLSVMAQRLKSDAFREALENSDIDGEKFFSKDNLRKIREECRKVTACFEAEVKDAAVKVTDALRTSGVDGKEFYRGFINAVYDYAEGRNDGQVERPSDSFMTRAADPDKWFSKANAVKWQAQVQPLLEKPLGDFAGLFAGPFRLYCTAGIIDSQIYALGVAGELDREFRAIMKEKNVLSIDDSNTILKNIIDGSDAPFIYEKIGVRFENFLLDEFQDTSRIQWDNFRPLLHESESQDFDNLIVGDVKQSIYRWRGSDWKLLDEEVGKEFPGAKTSLLDTNYRSCANIITFNNSFFRFVSGVLDYQYYGDGDHPVQDGGLSCDASCHPVLDTGSHHAEQSGMANDGMPDHVRHDHEPERRISDIYSDVRQKIKNVSPGNVAVSFCPKDSELAAVSEAISEAVSHGATFGDIAVLVRRKSDGAAVAAHLMAEGIPVITDDSLKVKSSVTVRRLVSLLSYTDNPEDTVSGYLARSLDISVPEKYLSLTDLCETLLRGLADDGVREEEVLHVQSFMDCVSDWSSSNGNDLRGFLKYWADTDPDIASPSMGNSVRVITVHKSKGLAFPYVIFPFAETVPLFRSENCWCSPEGQDGGGLDTAVNGIYDVRLSSSSEYTLFSKDYKEELKLQYVDNLNIMYVAMTRAEKGMHIISAMPSGKFVKAVEEDKVPALSDFSHALYLFCSADFCSDRDFRMMKSVSGQSVHSGHSDHPAHSGYSVHSGHPGYSVHSGHPVLDTGSQSAVEGILKFSLGEPEGFGGRPADGMTLNFVPDYPSFPLNPDETLYGPDGEVLDVRERGRLKFSADALDFFDDKGNAGAAASPRLRGIVLHDILSRVRTPQELKPAVDAALMAGELDETEAAEAYSLLSERIAEVTGRGWFPDDASKVLAEATLIDSDGSLHRPDRIVKTEDGLVIIDYKFGEHKRSYLRQIARYADICRRMGHSNVTACLWYVQDGRIIS